MLFFLSNILRDVIDPGFAEGGSPSWVFIALIIAGVAVLVATAVVLIVLAINKRN